MSEVVIKIPVANPLHFVKSVPSALPQYNYKHFDDWPFPLTIRYWETPARWYQPWQLSDHIRLQLLSEIGPVFYKVVRHQIEYGIDDNSLDYVAFSDQLQQKNQSNQYPGLYIYELDLDLSIFEEGVYSLVLEFGTPVLARMTSNTLVFGEVLDDTTLVEYKHRKQFGDMFFQTGFAPSIRCWGTMDLEKLSGEAVLFNNQQMDQTLISGKPVSEWRWYSGGPEGIPDFMGPKLNHIFYMSELKIEGRYYTRASEGTFFEVKDEADYPMKGWSIVLRDKLNQLSRSFIADTEQPLPDPDTGEVPTSAAAGLVAAITVDTKGFVEDDNGGSFYNIQDIE